MIECKPINPTIDEIKALKSEAECKINLILSALQWDTLCEVKSVEFISQDGFGATRIIHSVKIDLGI